MSIWINAANKTERVKVMIVTGIRNYTPIRQGENFVGNGRKKDVPDNRKVLFKKGERAQ